MLEKTKEIFEDESIELCPYCYQKIAKTHRESLISVIDSILNKEFNDHKHELLAGRLNEIEFDFQFFSDIDKDIVENINIKKNECNRIINEYNKKIDEKLSSIYNPIIINSMKLKERLEGLNKDISSLEAKRQEIEKSILIKESYIKRYNDILYGICSYRFNSDYIAYQTWVSHKISLIEKKKDLEKALKENSAQETTLLAERKNTSIAIDYINNALSYIFYDTNRLSLTAGSNGNYLLKSRGREVEPEEVSIGERNAIALCYFFSKISENCDRSHLFSNKSLIVLDDPISSFDLGNKMGIISYINNCLVKIIAGNSESKILLLTHDLASAYAFLDSVSLILNKKYASTSIELKNNAFSEFYKRKGEYEKLLTDVFEFAKGNNNDDAQYIGNAMRRIIEAFSTFVYNKGFRSIFYDDDILSTLGVNRNYFNGLSTALILNQRSHSEEQVKTLMDNGNLLEYMEADEIRSTAKDVICLLFALNENHVKSYITNESDRENIKEWLSNLTRRSPCI